MLCHFQTHKNLSLSLSSALPVSRANQTSHRKALKVHLGFDLVFETLATCSVCY